MFLMSEVPLYTRYAHRSATPRAAGLPPLVWMQGYLAHKKQRPPRNLRQDYAEGPVVVPGAGRFVVSEVPLYLGEDFLGKGHRAHVVDPPARHPKPLDAPPLLEGFACEC